MIGSRGTSPARTRSGWRLWRPRQLNGDAQHGLGTDDIVFETTSPARAVSATRPATPSGRAWTEVMRTQDQAVAEAKYVDAADVAAVRAVESRSHGSASRRRDVGGYDEDDIRDRADGRLWSSTVGS